MALEGRKEGWEGGRWGGKKGGWKKSESAEPHSVFRNMVWLWGHEMNRKPVCSLHCVELCSPFGCIRN